jgi:serine/threonine protein kinase
MTFVGILKSSFAQIELLSRLHHCHVVPLLGYCSESLGKTAERLLVFEYMPNGNLRESLDGGLGKDMDWATRVTIAIGAARGLEYLHDAAAPRILHSDVKSTNILLDENWKAKVRILILLDIFCDYIMSVRGKEKKITYVDSDFFSRNFLKWVIKNRKKTPDS